MKVQTWMDKLFHKRSMQYQLIVTYLLIILLPLLIVGSMSYRVAANIITDETLRANDLLLQSINRNVESYLKEIHYQSEIFTALLAGSSRTDAPNFLQSPENQAMFEKYVADLFRQGNDYISIRIFSDDGQIVDHAINSKTYRHRYNSPEELAWQEKMKANHSSELIFDMHALEVNGSYSFTASRALFDKASGKRIGYISYDKSLTSFVSYFRPIEYRSGGIMQIIRDHDTYLYHSNHALIGKKIDDEIRSRLKAISADSYVSESNKKDIIISYNSLLYSGIAVVGSVPLAELTKELLGLRNITMVVISLSVLLVIILSYHLSVYMTKPIHRLNYLMAKVERGDFDMKGEQVANSNREIHQLNASFHSMVSTINELIITQYKIELHKKDAELKALLMQINPHFLYNTLEVINGIADYEGLEQISDITQALSKMLRYNIDLSTDQVTLAEELENIRNFALILKSRFEDQLDIEWEIDDGANDCQIVKMVLQPLIENSIRHGVEKKLGKGLIHVVTKKIGERVEIRISDNGVGFSPEKRKDFEEYQRMATHSYIDVISSRNLGLKNVYTRLRIVYGKELLFAIDSEENKGTTIIINIPEKYDA